MRTRICLVICGGCLSLCAGCSHMVENRVVQAFSESLREHDLTRLKAASSEGFEKKAIDGAGTFDALKLVSLPEGTPKVTKVADRKDEDSKKVVEKRVTVQIGDKKSGVSKAYYVLKPDADSGQWVVDDVYLSRDDYKQGKSLGAQLSVLASLDASLDAWKSAERDRILAVATPEFAQALSDLSPGQLSQFANKVTADVARETGVRPQERLGDETAELSVPKLDGDLVFFFRRIDDRWKLDDLKVESRKGSDAIASVRHLAAAMSTALSFHKAYRGGDKQRLEEVCTLRLYDSCLAAADLTSVPLPGSETGMEHFDVKLEGKAATFVVPAGGEVVKISLLRDELDTLHATPRYRVDDVTIYELQTSQNKRLSALFTSHAALVNFSAALAAQDLEGLKQHATSEFKDRVWKHLASRDFAHLPLADIEPARPQIVQTLFKGSLTEVLIEQGNTPLTYVLRDEGGKMLVDDVLTPAPMIEDLGAGRAGHLAIRTESLKSRLELLVPVLQFASGLDESNLAQVRGCVTSEFARQVWNHYEHKAPDFDRDPFPHLYAPLARVALLPGDRAEMMLGNDRFGAQVSLEREGGIYRIDNVTFVSGPQPEQRIVLKDTIQKTRLARSP